MPGAWLGSGRQHREPVKPRAVPQILQYLCTLRLGCPLGHTILSQRSRSILVSINTSGRNRTQGLDSSIYET